MHNAGRPNARVTSFGSTDSLVGILPCSTSDILDSEMVAEALVSGRLFCASNNAEVSSDNDPEEDSEEELKEGTATWCFFTGSTF
jgi:hypothetical protein